MVFVLQLRNSLVGLSSDRPSCLSTRAGFSDQAPWGEIARHPPILGYCGLRRVGRSPAPSCPPWPSAVCFEMKPVGKPDAENPHVRFDERGAETGGCQSAPHRAVP